jgi:hypothetical protein
MGPWHEFLDFVEETRLPGFMGDFLDEIVGEKKPRALPNEEGCIPG